MRDIRVQDVGTDHTSQECKIMVLRNFQSIVSIGSFVHIMIQVAEESGFVENLSTVFKVKTLRVILEAFST